LIHYIKKKFLTEQDTSEEKHRSRKAKKPKHVVSSENSTSIINQHVASMTRVPFKQIDFNAHDEMHKRELAAHQPQSICETAENQFFIDIICENENFDKELLYENKLEQRQSDNIKTNANLKRKVNQFDDELSALGSPNIKTNVNLNVKSPDKMKTLIQSFQMPKFSAYVEEMLNNQSKHGIDYLNKNL
jgi:hypothetical protein